MNSVFVGCPAPLCARTRAGGVMNKIAYLMYTGSVFHWFISLQWRHNGAIASQITSFTIVYLTVYSDADQRKHQSAASLAFVWGIHRGTGEFPAQMASNAEMFSFDDVSWSSASYRHQSHSSEGTQLWYHPGGLLSFDDIYIGRGIFSSVVDKNTGVIYKVCVEIKLNSSMPIDAQARQ